jgi:predicted Holliday junction resolvase-like endonuclease
VQFKLGLMTLRFLTRLTEKEEKFEGEEEKLREIAREKGRKAAERVINRAICQSLRALKLDPFDVKPILNPIDFVVFKGMNKQESVSDILLLSREHNCPSLNLARQQIRDVVSEHEYEWQVARIDEKDFKAKHTRCSYRLST